MGVARARDLSGGAEVSRETVGRMAAFARHLGQPESDPPDGGPSARAIAIKLWGGGTLNGAMLRLGLIDEIHLVVWPVFIGGDATPTLADCMDLGRAQLPTTLQLLSAKPQDDGQVWLHYRVARDQPKAPAANSTATGN